MTGFWKLLILSHNKETFSVIDIIILITKYASSSYPQPPNFCMEAVIDRVMITCKLAHWMKQPYNQSAILLPAFGRSIRVLHNAYS